MIMDISGINGLIIIFLIFAIEWFLSWKVSHGIKEWGKNYEKGDLNSKLMTAFIMIALNFLFILGFIIVHASITNEPINNSVIYISFVLLVGYIVSLIFLLRFKGDKKDLINP